MSRIKDMTRGNPAKLILSFAFPLILTNLGQQFYMIADSAIVGRGVGVKALAAVGATDWSYWVILWTITTMTQGFATFVSRYFGEKDYEKMSSAIVNSLWATAGVAVVLTLLGLTCARPVLLLLKTPEDIRADSLIYLSTMIAGTLAVAGYNVTAAILRAFGDGKSPMIAMGISAALNIGLDLLTVFVLRWGVFGAALASVLAQFVAFLYCFRQIRKVEIVSWGRSSLRPDPAMLKELLLFGLPLALQYVVINISGMVLQSTINLQGSIFVAGYTAVNKVYGLLECSAISLGAAATTFFSQNYGARQVARVRSGVRTTAFIGIGMAAAVGAGTFLFGRQILSLFIDQAEAGSPEAIGIGFRYLSLMSASLCILYLIYVYRSILQAMGSSIPSMISGFTECAARIFVAKGLYAWLGQGSLYFAEPAAWLGSLVFIMGSYYALRSRYLK